VTSRTLALVPRAIALNLVMGKVVGLLGLPIYLDSMGTVLVAALCGPLAGSLTGALSNGVSALVGSPTMLAFSAVAAVVGAVAGWLCRFEALRTLPRAAVAGALTGVAAAATAAPIAARLFGGVTGGGTDLLVLVYRLLGCSVERATFLQGLTVDPLDKACTFVLVAWVLRVSPRRAVTGYPQAARALGGWGAGQGSEIPHDQ
jgi:energy-coupling factor transport system substrate-specific component